MENSDFVKGLKDLLVESTCELRNLETEIDNSKSRGQVSSVMEQIQRDPNFMSELFMLQNRISSVQNKIYFDTNVEKREDKGRLRDSGIDSISSAEICPSATGGCDGRLLDNIRSKTDNRRHGVYDTPIQCQGSLSMESEKCIESDTD